MSSTTVQLGHNNSGSRGSGNEGKNTWSGTDGDDTIAVGGHVGSGEEMHGCNVMAAWLERSWLHAGVGDNWPFVLPDVDAQDDENEKAAVVERATASAKGGQRFRQSHKGRLLEAAWLSKLQGVGQDETTASLVWEVTECVWKAEERITTVRGGDLSDLPHLQRW